MKIAVAQIDVALGDVDRNLKRIEALVGETARAGARLAIFPECAATGYCFDSLEEALPYGETLPGPAVGRVAAACARAGIFAIFGLLERDAGRLFNAAALVGPGGLVASYRKIHLPFLGVDRFTTPGDRPFGAHDAGALRVGLSICYDASFPEAARALALGGADLIALPTNWPPGSEHTAAHVINTRALENAVYFAAANRVGAERGFPFIGRSRIAAPDGRTLAASESDGEEILYAEIDPEEARRKHLVRVPGLHEIDRFADRRPEMYGTLTAPHALESPRHRHHETGVTHESHRS
jgi:predicted amidohydrolase